MDNARVAAALEEVQKAYSIVFDFNKVLQDMLRGFFKEFDAFSYYYRYVTPMPRNASPLDYSATCAVPANNFSVLYTKTTSEKAHLCLEKGDALVSCEVMINPSLSTPDAPDAICKPFVYAAVLAATEDVPLEYVENEHSNNWYYKIWLTTPYSDHGTSMKHPQKSWIEIYTEIIQLESMYDAASIKAVAAGFKERAAKTLGVTL